jgi:hypothetical protein
MGQVFDDKDLKVLQRAYDEVVHDLFGDTVPEECFRESIAAAILMLASAGQRDWEQMATYAGAQAKRMMRERQLLMWHGHSREFRNLIKIA